MYGDAINRFLRRLDLKGWPPFVYGGSPDRKVFAPKGTACRNFCRKKCRFWDQLVPLAASSRISVLRSEMVLNMFFGPLSIFYDVWMMFHFGLKKIILRLKIGPKVIFLPKSLLTFYYCKIDLFTG